MRCKPRIIKRSDFEGGLREVVLLFLFRELHEPTSPDTSRLVLHDMPFQTPFPGGRPSNLKVARPASPLSNFRLVQRSRAAAFSRYEAGLMVFYAQEPGVDRGVMLAQRSGKCVHDVTKLYEKQFFILHFVKDNEIVRSTSGGVEGKSGLICLVRNIRSCWCRRVSHFLVALDTG